MHFTDASGADTALPFSNDVVVFFGGATNNTSYPVPCVYNGSIQYNPQTSYTIKNTKKYLVYISTFGITNYSMSTIAIYRNGSVMDSLYTSGLYTKSFEIELKQGDVISVYGNTGSGNTLYTGGFFAILI